MKKIILLLLAGLIFSSFDQAHAALDQAQQEYNRQRTHYRHLCGLLPGQAHRFIPYVQSNDVDINFVPTENILADGRTHGSLLSCAVKLHEVRVVESLLSNNASMEPFIRVDQGQGRHSDMELLEYVITTPERPDGRDKETLKLLFKYGAQFDRKALKSLTVPDEDDMPVYYWGGYSDASYKALFTAFHCDPTLIAELGKENIRNLLKKMPLLPLYVTGFPEDVTVSVLSALIQHCDFTDARKNADLIFSLFRKVGAGGGGYVDLVPALCRHMRENCAPVDVTTAYAKYESWEKEPLLEHLVSNNYFEEADWLIQQGAVVTPELVKFVQESDCVQQQVKDLVNNTYQKQRASSCVIS